MYTLHVCTYQIATSNARFTEVADTYSPTATPPDTPTPARDHQLMTITWYCRLRCQSLLRDADCITRASLMGQPAKKAAPGTGWIQVQVLLIS